MLGTKVGEWDLDIKATLSIGQLVLCLIVIPVLLRDMVFLVQADRKLGRLAWRWKDLLNGLKELLPIYKKCLSRITCWMGFDHSFRLWFMARWLKPDLMIESFAFKGQSTWFLGHAMPNTRIISLSLRKPGKYLKKGLAYVNGNCTFLWEITLLILELLIGEEY